MVKARGVGSNSHHHPLLRAVEFCTLTVATWGRFWESRVNVMCHLERVRHPNTRSRALGPMLLAGAVALLHGGCDSISIAPACPRELRVGETGPVQANEINPGAIATYRWEVLPAEAGVFADPTEPTTTFEATVAGEAVLSLTASDGLYQVISFCNTRITSPTSVEVALEASSTEPEVGFLVTLTCTSVGETTAASFSVTQAEGATVALSELLAGVFLFTATQVGDLTFECVGESDDGGRSDPAVVTVAVVPVTEEPDNGDTNENGGGRRGLR